MYNTFIIWPERRWLTDAQVAVWYDDAVANGEVAGYEDITTIAEKAAELSDAGLITLGKPRAGVDEFELE